MKSTNKNYSSTREKDLRETTKKNKRRATKLTGFYLSIYMIHYHLGYFDKQNDSQTHSR